MNLSLDFSSPPITLDQARADRDEGMERVSDSTIRRDPTWADVAYQFLALYTRTHALINPETVCDDAAAWGLSEPRDGRAWGSVYQRAVRAGLIERSNVPYQRRKGHASVSLCWRSKAAV